MTKSSLYTYLYWGDNPDSRARDERLLRENGVYWPTDDEVMALFMAVRNRTVYEKLSDAETAPGKKYWLPLFEVLRELGSEWTGDMTGSFGYDYCGFYSEIQLLRRSRLLKFEEKNVGGERVCMVALDNLGLDWINDADDIQMLRSNILGACAVFAEDMAEEISRRARQFDMVGSLTRMAYRHILETK